MCYVQVAIAAWGVSGLVLFQVSFVTGIMKVLKREMIEVSRCFVASAVRQGLLYVECYVYVFQTYVIKS